MGEGFTAFSCGNEPAKVGEFVDLEAWRRTKVLLHVGRRQGQPKRILKDSASCRDQHCDRKTPLVRASAAEKRSESQPGCRSCRRKPAASCNRSGNNDCKDPVVPKGNTRTAARKGQLFGQNAKALCRSRQLNRNPAHGVSQSGFCGCQSHRSHPGESGKESANDNGGSARTESGLARKQEFRDGAVRESWHEEPFGDSRMRNQAGRSPVGLTSVARVTTDNRRRPTVMLGGREFIVQSRWPGRLAILSWRKLRDRSASLETAETLESESFSDVRGPIPTPRGRRDNKERRIGGRPAEFRRQASSFGHSQGLIAR